MNVCDPRDITKNAHAKPESLISSLREHGNAPFFLNQLRRQGELWDALQPFDEPANTFHAQDAFVLVGADKLSRETETDLCTHLFLPNSVNGIN